MADKIRLLELRNTYKWGGGPDKTILLSAEQHDRKRVEVVVAYVRDDKDKEFQIGEKARTKGLEFYEIEERSKIDLGVLQKLSKIVAQHDINLIHAHDYKSDLFAYLLRRKMRQLRPALISTMHGWALDGFRGRVLWRLDVSLMRTFDHLIAVSRATKKQMVDAGIPTELISVVHNGIDTHTWSPCQTNIAMREALGLESAVPIIGYVGRLSAEKDLYSWLRAVALVATEYPQAQFVIVGEGRNDRLLAELRKMAAGLDIADKVKFLGYRDNLPAIYAIFDIFFLSSLREGICNSLLEAMAMGIPVVATDVGGTKELVIDGQTGYMVPNGDFEAMAQSLLRLASNAGLRKELGIAGRKRIEDKFSFRCRLSRVETLYERIIEQRTAPRLERHLVISAE
jgi:glycosyltransferase involved in cell wall biosynthesis